MVAAADQLAASAGIGLLAHGGSAADAAVATGTVMAVVGPHLCGLGGDVLAMVAPAGIVPRGARWPSGAPGSGSDPAAMRAEGHAVMPLRRDVRSVQVPGAVDGWLALHARLGRLPLAEVLAPAIELAEDGFAASIMLALASHLVHVLPGADELCPAGPLEVGQRVRLPGIARTLRRHCRATGATPSTRASSAAASSRWAAAISTRSTSPRAWRQWCTAPAPRPGATTCGPCRPRRRAT